MLLNPLQHMKLARRLRKNAPKLPPHKRARALQLARLHQGLARYQARKLENPNAERKPQEKSEQPNIRLVASRQPSDERGPVTGRAEPGEQHVLPRAEHISSADLTKGRCGSKAAGRVPGLGGQWLGNTVRYTELSSGRFKGCWKD